MQENQFITQLEKSFILEMRVVRALVLVLLLLVLAHMLPQQKF
jgi:hypothetical protein